MTSQRRELVPEKGTALILVLIFLAAMGPVLAGLVTLSGTNLLNTSNLGAQRNLEFSGDAALDGAIQLVRTVPACSAACISPPTPGTAIPCPTYPSATVGLNEDGVNLMVDCSASVPSTTGTPFYGRLVYFDACNVTAATTSFSACESAAVVKAEVYFDDEATTNPFTGLPCATGATAGCYGSSWGTQMTVLSWTVQSATG